MVVLGSLALGIRIAWSMKGRILALKEMERILAYLEGELRCRHSMLAEALYNVSLKSPEPYSSWLFELMRTVEGQREDMDKGKFNDFYTMWYQSLEDLRHEALLAAKDISLFYDVGKALGYLDIESQQMNLNLEREHIHSYILELDKDVSLRMKNAVILCFLGGVMTVIALL